VADHQHGVGVGGEILLQPQRAFEIEVVGRLVEQQQIRLAEQHARQRHAHAPAARKIGGRRVLLGEIEAETLENGRSARLRRVRVDVGQPCVDFSNPVSVSGVLGLREQCRPLCIGRHHHVERGRGRSRRLLRHAADPGFPVHLDIATFDGKMALDEMEQRSFARAVLADKAGLRAIGQHHGGAVEQKTALDAIGKIVDREHDVMRNGARNG
jgi:hypothetical protein